MAGTGTAPETVYAIFVDGVQKGGYVNGHAMVTLADGEYVDDAVEVYSLREGDKLEGGIVVKSVTLSDNKAIVNVLCEHVV